LLWPMHDLFADILTQTVAQNIEYLFWISEHLPMFYDSLLDVERFRTSVRPICIGTHPGGVVRHGVSVSWNNSNAITEFVWIIDVRLFMRRQTCPYSDLATFTAECERQSSKPWWWGGQEPSSGLSGKFLKEPALSNFLICHQCETWETEDEL
jgi:hypothetical protein